MSNWNCRARSATGWQIFAGANTLRSTEPDGSRHNGFLPRSNVKLFITYRLQGAWEKLTLGGGARWQGPSYVDIATEAGDVRFRQGSTVLVDMMARYDLNDALALQLNVNNLFDKDYFFLRRGDTAPRGAGRNATLTLASQF